MKVRLIRIGNSRGIRLPKSLIEEVGLSDEIELEVHPDGLLLRPARPTRSGWADAAAALAESEAEGLLDPPSSTRFDDEEWEW